MVGPTASGKTQLGIRLAEAVDGEVVSADSVQIYRHFDIGSGKPTPEERARVPHHLVDFAEPSDPMDAARWARLAEEHIADIRKRGKVPILCGGTYLWIRALVHGLAPAPPGDPVLRARHREIAERQGRDALHAELRRLDRESAERLNPNDFVRVSRALEVVELTGKPMSAWQAEHGFREQRHAVRLVGVRFTPERLAERIESRARRMLEAGWAAEVERLRAQGFGQARAMASVGYRQIAQALDEGGVCEDELLRRVTQATRVFARRQRTWLRDAGVEWLDPDEAARWLP